MASLGVVGCAARKLPTPAPAWLLYSASPVFSQAYQAARAACDKVLILSGAFGIIEPEVIIAPYDQRADMTPAFARQVAQALEPYTGWEILAYCSDNYTKALSLVQHRPVATGNMFARTAAIGKQGSVKGNTFPLAATLRWLHANSGATLDEYKSFCQSNWTHPITQRCQYDRLLKSSFARIQDGRIYYAYTPS